LATQPQPTVARPPRRWEIAPPHPERDALARDARVSPLVAQMLLNRGVLTPQDAEAFLNPDIRAIHPPERLHNAERAAERLAVAVAAGRRIVIYGDYDVDGVTATTILWHVLRIARANVATYVPNRLEEGYGLNGEALERIAADGGELVITVDCGVTAIEEARRARALGVELIITDHHQPRAELPDALVVHPLLGDPPYPNPDLPGAGVALKVAWALARRLSGAERVSDAYRAALNEATVFTALGVIADVAALRGENRVLATHGLRQMPNATNPGLRALIETARLGARRQLSEYDVGFILAPRLNAIGRMGHAAAAVELFTVADARRAAEIARELDQHNRWRQSVEQKIVEQAEAQVLALGLNRDGCRGIVLADEAWHAGVIGIVASRMVERFGRPTVLIALHDGVGQGSGRSIRHFPLHEALECCGEHLLSHGGHAMAAGLRIAAERVEAFRAAFERRAADLLTAADLERRVRIDEIVPLAQVDLELLEALRRMAPFGPGNPRPCLCVEGVQLVGLPTRIGAGGAHLAFTVRDGDTHRRAIEFGGAARFEELADAPRIRVAFEPTLNEWNGRRSAELRVVDWAPV